ncbi:MAG: bifunctional 5,10-methylenetetrahydrofolate dehydrogenase/5,10-methenyltetrahydrofolate cyclohydrolase [Elusimicrobiota bacterium]|jgi:methylenetetrahydrofolate dehydrogenase (NADP+)/methenyltetrahydrofolate cyclohydrolase|nr:bifunctional 5,10-methylenetetrahydrofolate dehydrogenase/5,10-methenyltetrahydrofolate cyclohydrolase [Elusimicrobiota bacterium]
MILIDGKKVAAAKKEEIRKRVQKITSLTSFTPCLATILVGDDPSSKVYIASKIKACQEVGIKSLHFNLPQSSTKDEIIAQIETLNRDRSVSAVLLQLPLPQDEMSNDCIRAIKPSKDVDGLHPYNAGRLMLAKNPQEAIFQSLLIPCTPVGIMGLIENQNIQMQGKNAVVIGRSNLVGKPIAVLLLLQGATVTIAHSKTQNLKEICKKADIIVSAVGKAGLINRDFVKEGAVVIDVGISKNAEGKIKGDVDFESVKDMDIYLTPVPGGVGPMTIASLLENTLKTFEKIVIEEN